ncbi:RnfABCDGE type electron transport complex subunit G [Oscillospiraceae bacterium OttesenSCG-928-F05]|nr:RnfABCDGE type electron transport complex subunit G [Oscillospiraceae bacterium OttesenSCG-928-F05]
MTMQTFVKTNLKYFLQLALTLFIITAAMGILLAGVNVLTKDRIAANRQYKTEAAMAEVLPGAEFRLDPVFETDSAKVYEGRSGGTVQGYAISVAPMGFGGAIDMIVGVDAEGTVTGISIVSMSETAGLGTKVNDGGFLGQFAGVADWASDSGQVQAISGATVSSRAVMSGVDTALKAYKDFMLGGGA